MAKKKSEAVGPGHNSALTDDERRALTLHHKRLYEVADHRVEQAKAERTAVADLAKADLGKGALADIKDMILANNTKKMKAVVERVQRLARWAGLAIGSQPQLFEANATDHFEDGKTAGMEGLACEPPKTLAVDASQKWISGWRAGQSVLASAFKKKRPVDGSAADPAQTDIEHDTALAREAEPA